MMQKLPSTADRIVLSAMKLFLEKGYASTSVQDILREADANAGSLYHAFATKQDVLIAVLKMYKDGIGPMLLAPAWEAVDAPIERVFALLNAYRRALELTDCTYGCPIGSLALELHEPDPSVRDMLAANFDVWVSAVKACLDAAPLPTGTDTRALSQFVLTVMEGGVMQARTLRALSPFDASVAELRRYLDFLLAIAERASAKS